MNKLWVFIFDFWEGGPSEIVGVALSEEPKVEFMDSSVNIVLLPDEWEKLRHSSVSAIHKAIELCAKHHIPVPDWAKRKGMWKD